MKHYLIAMALTFCILKSIGQDTTFVQSKYELFNNRQSVLLKTETKSIDLNNYGFNVDRIRSIEVYTGNEMSVIRMFAPGDKRPVFIDFDDIDSIINVLKFFSVEAAKPKPKSNDIIYNYTTPNDIYISYFFPTGVFSAPSVTIGRLSRYSRMQIPSSIMINKKRIIDFIDMLNKEKQNSF